MKLKPGKIVLSRAVLTGINTGIAGNSSSAIRIHAPGFSKRFAANKIPGTARSVSGICQFAATHIYNLLQTVLTVLKALNIIWTLLPFCTSQISNTEAANDYYLSYNGSKITDPSNNTGNTYAHFLLFGEAGIFGPVKKQVLVKGDTKSTVNFSILQSENPDE